MNFYEFNDYEHYALIVDYTEKDALEEYQDVVADIEGEEIDKHPDVISEEIAVRKFINAQKDGYETKEDKYKEFYKELGRAERDIASTLIIEGYLA